MTTSTFPRLHPRLQDAIVSRLGWTTLRPVQDLAGEALLSGDNAVILAPTAGGKTEAALFPTLSLLLEDPPEKVGALYIAPIKALLNNQAERLGLYTEMVGLRRFVWHGDTETHSRRQFLKEPSDLLMTTPESLEVMLVSQRVDSAALFADVRIVVIDEIHAIAGTDRGAHLMSVLERIADHSRHDLQRVGLSATVGNPEVILRWLQGTSRRAGRVVDPPKMPTRRQLKVFHRPLLPLLAQEAARVARGTKSLFFCQSRSTTEVVAEHMRRAGTSVFVHHSAVSKEERELAEERFHHGSDACIVCTSTLELGIDVGDLDRVLQAEAPDTVSSFLQRLGRTGRRQGQIANTTFFCESEEGVLQSIALIELARSGWVEAVEVQERTWPVVIHQLLAMALAYDGVTLEHAWQKLSRVPDFRGIHQPEFERLVRHMLRDRSLVLADGRLVIGPKAEKRFGRRHFMELYAVFSSPQSYAVLTADAQPLGTLSQAFVDRLVDGVSSFLLGGRAWVVLQIHHSDRRVLVESAPRGRQPTWGGILPQFLGKEICQRILDVLCSDEAFAYISEEAAQVLQARRDALRGVLSPQLGGLEVVDEEVRWWTFAGGRINSTLRYALQAVARDWKIIPDNFVIKLRGESVSEGAVRAAIERLNDIELWENERLWADVASDLPNYRLSKFQPLMPPWVEREVVAGFLLDVAGAWRWLAGESQSRGRHLERVPASVRKSIPDVGSNTRTVEASGPSPVVFIPQVMGRERVWIQTPADLQQICVELSQEAEVGLDVETTLGTQALCLIQLATRSKTYLIDALEVSDLSALQSVLGSPDTTKLIHHAEFERRVLGRYGLTLSGVVDTLEVSRALRGRGIEGGHSLRAVCARELNLELDKAPQTSDWATRPLSPEQLSYAALDAEVLLRLKAVLGGL